MHCDNPKIFSIDKMQRMGCCWSNIYKQNRWGNFPGPFETFAGDYQNNILKPNNEEKFFTSLEPLR